MSSFFEWVSRKDVTWAITGIGFGLCCLIFAAIGGSWMIGYFPHPLPIIAVLALAFGIAQLKGLRWARWMGLAWIIVTELLTIFVAIILGWDALMIVAVLVIAVGIFDFVRHFFRAGYGEEEDDGPFMSLVLLFRERPYLDATVVAGLASRAWGIEVEAYDGEEEDEDEDSAEFETASIIGQPPLMIGMHPDAMLMIHAFDTPYFEDPEDIAADVNELRIRKAILEHEGWVAMDVLNWHGDGDGEAQAYRMIARFLAELADENVLAIIDPDAETIFPYDPELEQKLRCADPRAQLREQVYVPIVTVSEDDPDMVAAVEEAQRRWPEFVAAFEQRHDSGGENFSIKAPFGEENSVEFMWVAVTAIENEVVYGELGNDPAAGTLKIGDRVTVNTSDVNDWIYINNDDMVGGFTVKVLAERSRQPPPSE